MRTKDRLGGHPPGRFFYRNVRSMALIQDFKAQRVIAEVLRDEHNMMPPAAIELARIIVRWLQSISPAL